MSAFPKCPKCAFPKSSVIDTRLNADGYIRRRRACLQCQHRWTTWELREDDVLHIKDLMRQLVEKLKGFRPAGHPKGKQQAE